MTIRETSRAKLSVLPWDMESGAPVAAILDSIPCGIMVLDRQRRIRYLNDAFTRALQITDSDWFGSCQGHVLGCVHAVEGHDHQRPAAVCEGCALAELTARAFETGQRIRGRATVQVASACRLRDITLECTAIPVTVAAEALVVVLIDSVSELHELHPAAGDDSTLGMIGRHASMLELFEVIHEVGPLKVPVLIQGETGTGKELVAVALHQTSTRRDRLMVTVNCGALPENLLESELFGHVKGAFTGALREKKGRFALADRGTIFLDEIGELSPAMQVKFLRVLQDGTFEPVGSEHTVRVDVRVVCATNRDLEAEVEQDRFRADLYYRLCVMPIRVPPLRERTDDIPPLVQHFLGQVAAEHPELETRVANETLAALMSHDWPGNVRELENVVRYAAIRARGAPITCAHLPPGFDERCGDGRAAGGIGRPRRALDREAVQQALREAGGNRSRAAERLGVSRTTLWRFLRERPDLCRLD